MVRQAQGSLIHGKGVWLVFLPLLSHWFVTWDPRGGLLGQPLDTFFIPFFSCMLMLGRNKKTEQFSLTWLELLWCSLCWLLLPPRPESVGGLCGDGGRGYRGGSLLHNLLNLILFMCPVTSSCLSPSLGCSHFCGVLVRWSQSHSLQRCPLDHGNQILEVQAAIQKLPPSAFGLLSVCFPFGYIDTGKIRNILH